MMDVLVDESPATEITTRSLGAHNHVPRFLPGVYYQLSNGEAEKEAGRWRMSVLLMPTGAVERTRGGNQERYAVNEALTICFLTPLPPERAKTVQILFMYGWR